MDEPDGRATLIFVGERLLERRAEANDASRRCCEVAYGYVKVGAAAERGDADGEMPRAFGFC
jgi:hypothetical protein